MVEAVSALTYLAEEMRMLVVVVILVVTVAEFVFRAVAAALNGVHKMMFPKQRKSPEDVRFVDGCYPPFQLCQRLRQHGTGQFPDNNDSVRCGLDTVLFKQTYT